MNPDREKYYTAAPKAEPSAPGPSAHILYVDDNSALRGLYAKLLTLGSYRVDVAEDGQAGWEKLRSGAYDLLITDHMMPRLTGLELVNRLRSAGHTLPVLIASSSFTGPDDERLSSLHVTAVLPKPFNPEQLLATVKMVLRPHGMEHGREDTAKAI